MPNKVLVHCNRGEQALFASYIFQQVIGSENMVQEKFTFVPVLL